MKYFVPVSQEILDDPEKLSEFLQERLINQCKAEQERQQEEYCEMVMSGFKEWMQDQNVSGIAKRRGRAH